MAQVAHATAAVRTLVLLLLRFKSDRHLQVLHETRDSPDTISYMEDLKNMRKVEIICLYSQLGR